MTFASLRPRVKPTRAYTVRKNDEGEWILTIRGEIGLGWTEYTCESWSQALEIAAEHAESRRIEYQSFYRMIAAVPVRHTGLTREIPPIESRLLS